MRKLIIILFIAVLQSCSSDGYRIDVDSRLSKKINSESDNVILITRAETKSINYEGKIFDRNFNKMNWCTGDNKKRCKDILYFNPYTKIKFRSDYRSDFDYDFYVTKPGYYYLNQVEQLRGYREDWYLIPTVILSKFFAYGVPLKNIPNFNSSSGWNKKLDAPNFASFEAKAGEIVYIGDLFFTFTKQKYWMKGKVNLEIEDSYDEAVRYFRAQYPEYKDKPVIKRLAKPGVLLDNYDAGIFW
ncbi:MAG: hypothetical protein K0R25_2 [Rickettsiaceae bacterium]|jgi:hypothetical protein|nr:hypothetical protein [Rickettsiaceae bacterium]